MNCKDDYINFLIKVQRSYKFVLENFKDVDYILKIDDDCAINVNKALKYYEMAKKENYDLIASIRDGEGHMSGPTYFCSRRCAEFLSTVPYPDFWDNEIFGILWNGVSKHISDKKMWNLCVPEDYYLSSKIRDNGTFKIKNLGGEVDYNYNFNDKKQYLSVHNINDFIGFYQYYLKINKENI